MKDKRKTEDQAGVVYKLECKDCTAVYIGETGRQLKARMKEHKDDIQKKKLLSNVYSHCRTYDHQFNFDSVKVIERQSNTRVR